MDSYIEIVEYLSARFEVEESRSQRADQQRLGCPRRPVMGSFDLRVWAVTEMAVSNSGKTFIHFVLTSAVLMATRFDSFRQPSKTGKRSRSGDLLGPDFAAQSHKPERLTKKDSKISAAEREESTSCTEKWRQN
jgi:hypothetical protein